MRIAALLAAAALMLAGCAANTITGRNQLMLVSEDTAIKSSYGAYAQMMGGLGKKKQIETEGDRVKRVREITDRLIAQAVRFRPDSASWNWEVQVINDPKTVNAFCMAGGKMAIYSGMWEKLKATDEEIAAVMGHEIGHALASHTRERMSVAYSTTIGTTIAAIALGARQDTAALMQTAAAVAIQLPNSRESEIEADQIGIELAARAGYDPAAAVTLWEKMGKLGGGNPPEFLSTHPSPQNRAARLKELAVQVQPLYVAARARRDEATPSFLSAREGANERTVTRPGELTREEFAARAAAQPETMTFLAEPFERFKSGKAVFDCRVQCAFAYGNRRNDWRKLHEQKRWRDLAISVMQVGYLSDLSYFLLAESAKGLGLREASATYYKRALEAGREHGCGDGCEGFEVRRLSAAALK
ncbi:MAG TPA: M48 family metallopeptidase [Burkholderiales bacterium]|nr:M48 family metallopeptidase [Burkholderiales bacterium]